MTVDMIYVCTKFENRSFRRLKDTLDMIAQKVACNKGGLKQNGNYLDTVGPMRFP